MPSVSRFKVASKREQNKFIYYVEREQLRRSQYRKAGLKEKGERVKSKDERAKIIAHRSPLIAHPLPSHRASRLSP